MNHTNHADFLPLAGIQQMSLDEIDFICGSRGEWSDLGPTFAGGMVGGAVAGAISGIPGGVHGVGLGATAGAIGGGIGAVVTWYLTPTKKK